MNTLKRFIGNFENTVEGIEPGTLNAETAFRSLKQWDSLAVLMFIDMVDAEYDVRLNSRRMKEAETLRDLYGLVTDKKEAE